MNATICLTASSLYYPQGGGHLWAYLNWALGFRSLGCRVIWLEAVKPVTPANELRDYVVALKNNLAPYGLADEVALWQLNGEPLSAEKLGNCLDIETVAKVSDLLLNQRYNMCAEVLRKFRRTALLDIDPGLLQMWLYYGSINLAPHDVYFTIGETVGQQTACFPDGGIPWQYTPPCVSVEWWQTFSVSENAPFTTVTHWSMEEWERDKNTGKHYENDKRTAFLPFLELPRHSPIPLELAILLGEKDKDELKVLLNNGWRVRNSHEIASTPSKYHHYIQQSKGEFSCVKPSCIRLQNAWISDRSICYLASGKPVIVQHTGPSRFLPDDAGLFRFHDLKDAIRCLERVAADYDNQCKLARALAEEYFDARKVTASLLERAFI